MLIVDTGFWLALANRKDDAHQSATQLFQKLENEEFIETSTPIAGKIQNHLKIYFKNKHQ